MPPNEVNQSGARKVIERRARRGGPPSRSRLRIRRLAANVSAMDGLPYRIAVLCYLFDEQGRTLLLHRSKAPNLDLYSPIGGKLEQATGESPTECALREIDEEAGIILDRRDLHLTGVISERSYEGAGHWLIFLFEGLRPVIIEPAMIAEGRLEWHELQRIAELPIPETDRRFLWPMFKEHRGGFFMGHIDCSGGELRFTLDESRI